MCIIVCENNCISYIFYFETTKLRIYYYYHFRAIVFFSSLTITVNDIYIIICVFMFFTEKSKVL